ncbi:MAG TPA: hypothetical protein PKZ52_07125, partial [Cellvibrionaceae bacterium]|nr:hypothetical protein [Cellvibrionaceae bacterium]
MTGLALIFIGYSLLAAISLALTQFRPAGYADAALPRVMGLVVLAALFVLQGAHFAWLYYNRPSVAGGLYQIALFAVAPAFYLFSQQVLNPAAPLAVTGRLASHGVPVLVAWALPN